MDKESQKVRKLLTRAGSLGVLTGIVIGISLAVAAGPPVGNVRWGPNTPTFYVHAGTYPMTSSTARATAPVALQRWDGHSDLNWTNGGSTTDAVTNSCSSIVGSYLVIGGGAPSTGGLATTTWCINGSGDIAKGAVVVDSTPGHPWWLSTSTSGLSNSNYDFYSTVAHEGGHASAGSNHATNAPYCFPDDVAEESLEATMCDFLNTGTSHYRTLTNWDKAVVISNY